tara:strand:+ start:249 stop:422 length:174 start_codon:yes stop_codon:yes gene_type:complete
MDERKLYTVLIGGLPHSMLLDSADAKRLGGRAVEAKQAEPENKSRKPANKSASVSKK